MSAIILVGLGELMVIIGGICSGGFIQVISTFLTDKANLGSPTKKGRKDKPYVIPNYRFTKIIICHLGRIHNIHQRSTSPFHLAEEDFKLGNLKFAPKGKIDEVFGMPIPDELISNNIRNVPYYNAYLEMFVKHDWKMSAEKEGTKKTVSAKQPKSKPAVKKASKPTPALKRKASKERPSKASADKPPKLKPAKEKSTKTTLPQPTGKGIVVKVHKAKSPFQMVDGPNEEPAHSEPEPELVHQGEGDEENMELAIQMSLESFQAQSQEHIGGVAIREPIAEATRPLPVVEGKGKAIAIEEQAAHSMLVLHTPKRRSTTDQFVLQRQTLVTKEASTGPSTQAQDNTSKGKDVDEQLNLDENKDELDQGQAGSDPGRILKSRPPPEKEVMDEDQAGPDPRESRRALAGPNPEPTHDEFMTDLYPKNLDDAYTIRDQFINDKSTKDEPGKLNVESEVVSMVTVLIHQASSSIPPLSTPIIDLSPPKPASFTKAPIFTVTTTTTKTNLPLPPPLPQQSTSNSELVACVTTLEQKLAAFEKKSKTLDNTAQNLGSRVFTSKLRDLPHKIDEDIRESVKEAVHIALQAPLRDRFRELPEADMKEILHQRMDEILAEKDKSRKRRCDDQDHPPPPPDLDLTWKKFDTQEAHPSSSKQQSDPHAEKPVEDMPMPDTANISDSEDTDSAYLLEIKQRPEWLKPIQDDEIPATLEPALVIPSSYIPDAMNNWANTLATMYQAPVENSLLEKTGDMRTFMHLYCQQIGKTELTQADFEGQAYEVVKAFYPDVVQLQFQMEECHKMLTDQIDWANPEGDQVRIDVSKPLPLSALPGHVTIQTQFFFNHDLDYLWYGSKGSGQALSISKMKAARYLDFGLELIIPEHMWINKVEDFQLGIESYQKQLNLTKLGWDAKGFEYKHDYTIIDSPRAAVFLSITMNGRS
nr:hypothetical protein [Tanacetum cinerariifolium]